MKTFKKEVVSLKVLFISRLYPNTFDPRNGAVIEKQALELKKNGHEVIVVSPIPRVPYFLKNFRDKWKEYNELPNRQIIQGIEVYYPKYITFPQSSLLHFSHLTMKSSVTSIFEMINKIGKVDIIHAHMGYPDNLVVNEISRRNEIPLVTTIRSTDLDITYNNKKKRKYLESSLNSSCVVITPSFQLKEKLSNKLGIDSIQIGNGIYPQVIEKEISNYKIQDFKLLKKFKEQNKKIVISISNLIESKGIEDNICAVEKVINKNSNLIYIVIGSGPKEKSLKELVKKLNLEEKVYFTGALDHAAAMFYLKHSDMFSLPSWRETFGLVYLEAMYFNKPIIMCESQGLHGIISNNENGYIVKPRSSEEIAKVINLLFTHPEEVAKTSGAGKSIVLENFTWEKIGKKLTDIYSQSI